MPHFKHQLTGPLGPAFWLLVLESARPWEATGSVVSSQKRGVSPLVKDKYTHPCPTNSIVDNSHKNQPWVPSILPSEIASARWVLANCSLRGRSKDLISLSSCSFHGGLGSTGSSSSRKSPHPASERPEFESQFFHLLIVPSLGFPLLIHQQGLFPPL